MTVLRILAKLSLDPNLAPVLAYLQKFALQQVLLLSGFSAQDADRIASAQNWQIAFDELSKLVMQRFRPELEDFLPEGMRWEQVEKSLATVGQVDSVSEFVAKVKSPEEFARGCLIQIALFAVKEVVETYEVQPNILESVFQTFDREQLIEVLKDPARFIEPFKKEGGTLAMKIIMEHLRAHLKDKMPDGITWEEVETSLKEMSLERLREGLSDPATFWTRLVETFGPLAIEFALEQAKPAISEIILQMPGNMQWLDAKNVLVNYCSDSFNSIEGLKDASQSFTTDEQAQKKFILALARASLEKHLPTEVTWSDVERFAEKVEPEDLRAVAADPAGRGLSGPWQIHLDKYVV